jgi:hypothetical protein
VQHGPSGTFVYVVQGEGEEDRASLRPVSVSHQTETVAVIAKGLDGSERVVTTGFSRLKDGAIVTGATAEEQETAAAERKAAGAAEKKPDPRAALRAACSDDIQKFCADAGRGKDMRACLQANASSLSAACKAAAAQARASRKGEARKAGGSSTQ